MNFYTVIIGTELLNGRRKDAHFEFVNGELLKRGWEQKASFVIKDEPYFIEQIFRFIQSDPNSVMFCFGGIGATPDDYTRVAAANVFQNGSMEYHEEAKRIILEKFGESAYPHRIEMAHLPIKSGLLENIVSGVPGFYIDKRFFFSPGFPSMARDMVLEALNKFYPNNTPKYRLTLTANTSENTLIDTMKLVDEDVELSSLPQMSGNIRKVVISICGYEATKVQKSFGQFITFLEQNRISYIIGEAYAEPKRSLE